MAEVTAADLKESPSTYQSSRKLFEVLIGEDTAAPLIEASLTGDITKLRSLLAQSPWTETVLESPHRIYSEDRPPNNQNDVRGVLAMRMSNLERMISAAAENGQAAAVSILFDFALQHGVDPASVTGRRTIRKTIVDGHIAILKIFAAMDSNFTTRNLGHSTRPLDLAVMRHQLEVATVLFQLGASQDVQKSSRRTPEIYGSSLLSRATRGPIGFRMTELLLQHGISVAGSGALHTAAEEGNLDTINLLLQHGADVNEQLREDTLKHFQKSLVTGWTPLHFAASSGQVDAMELLKSHGAQADLIDKNGKTALQVLKERDQEAFV